MGTPDKPTLKKSGLLIDDRVQRFMSVEQMQSVHYLHQKIVLDAAEAQKQKPIFLSTSTICLFVGYLLASYIRTHIGSFCFSQKHSIDFLKRLPRDLYPSFVKKILCPLFLALEKDKPWEDSVCFK